MTQRNLNLSKTRGRILGIPKTGKLGSQIPSTGVDGPGYLYPSLDLPADANTEVCGTVTTLPTAGVLAANEDTSFTFTGAPDGSYFFIVQEKAEGVPVGSPITVTLNVGSGVTISCSPGNAVAGGPSATPILTRACTPGNAAAGGPTALIGQGVVVSATPGNAAAGGPNATITQNNSTTIFCSAGDAAATGPAATVYQGAAVNCAVGGAAAGGPAAAVHQIFTISCTPGNAAAGGATADIQAGGVHTISCTAGNAAAGGVNAHIYSGALVPAPNRTLCISLDETIASPKLFRKVVDEVLDYTFDWTRVFALTDDLGVSFSVVIAGTVVEGVNVQNNAKVSVWTAGGDVDTESLVTCHVVTLQGRQYSRSFRLGVVAAH